MSTTKSIMTIIDLINPLNTPRWSFHLYNTPFFMIFSRINDIIQSFYYIQLLFINIRIFQEEKNNEIIITDIWSAEEIQADINIIFNNNNLIYIWY